MHISFAMTAGQRIEFYEPGDFFRLMAATSDLSIEYYRNGKEIAEAIAITVGYAEKFEGEGFDRFAITNGATAQTITIASRNGSSVQYDTPPNGQVTVTNTGTPSWNQAQKTVTTTSGLVSGANTARRYLLIQNNDLSGTIYIRFGVTATIGPSIKIDPGGSFSMEGTFCHTGAIHAIGDIASNPNVMFLENT